MNNLSKWLPDSSLRTRMLLVFLLILAVIVVVTIVTVQQATYRHSTGQVLAHAKTSAMVVQDKILNQSRQLQAALDTLGKDFSTKQLIASGSEDPASLVSALGNHQRRINADLSWVQNNQQQILATTASFITSPLPPELASSSNISWFRLGSDYYLVQAVPVRYVESSPTINAWWFAAINARRFISEELVTLTDMQISLFSPDGQLLDSTLDEELKNGLSTGQLQWDSGLNLVNLGQGKHLDEYIYASFNIGEQRLSLKLLLASPADNAYLSYNSLLVQLILLLAIAGLLALLAAVIISNGITRPLTRLVQVTNKISRGQYVETVPESSTSEIASLSVAIQDMQQGIKQRELEIQQLAYFDALTGLPNRNQFIDHLQQLIHNGQTNAAVLMMDLDRFKDINDTLGHVTGDQLLQLIAERLANLQLSNLFPARLGGDEFGLIWLCQDSSALTPLLEAVEQLFEQPFMLKTLRMELDASIGVARFPEDGQDPASLLQCADIAMYSCKGKHQGHAVYKAELNKYSVQRLSLMSELRGALGEGQLQLYYQPKLDLAHNKVVGAECLVRWIHPIHGFIPPDQFIPLAEQTGAIRELTHWALRSALVQQQQWQEQGYTLNLAVNISPLDLVDMKLPDVLSELADILQQPQLNLTLEVTESAVMSDPSTAIDVLEKLRSMDLVLSIDDFGTGYSSMAQLKKMPVQELKIDKAFVLDLASNADDQVMVRTFISLARHLGLDTVAEGVEDAKTLSLLRQMGCTKAQGYYLSKPLPANAFFQWLQEYQHKETRVCEDG
ncbi:bifunctional diguanylate cyclase/phosphodiesterase [Bowmanella denitrificans]|uniref:Bifunctional diguanylate cyclase/phosphodiesterase n=1 Tax=Bowmanella denitrificans TaxID=366582 RepID=A0ABN0XE23_9ALTE